MSQANQKLFNLSHPGSNGSLVTALSVLLGVSVSLTSCKCQNSTFARLPLFPAILTLFYRLIRPTFVAVWQSIYFSHHIFWMTMLVSCTVIGKMMPKTEKVKSS